MTMLHRKPYRKLWGVLLIPAVFTFAAIVGGIEWAFASLGMMVLIGISGIGIYVLAKVLRHSYTSSKPAKARPISKEYKRLIMKHIDELLVRSRAQSVEKLAEIVPISKEDKKLVMKHIDELFTIGRERSSEKPAEAAPISKEDSRLIMGQVDELFARGQEQTGEKLS